MTTTLGTKWSASDCQVSPRDPAPTVSQFGAPACPPLYSESVPGVIVHAPTQSFRVVYVAPGAGGHALWGTPPSSPGSPSTQPNEKLTESPTTNTSWGSVEGGGGPKQAARVPTDSATPATRSANLRNEHPPCPAEGNELRAV